MVLELPASLAAIAPYLDEVKPPSEPFDAAGTWSHRYRLWLSAPVRSSAGNGSGGWLRLTRRPGGQGRFSLDIALAAEQTGASTYRLDGRMTCATDPLATPLHWEVTGRIVNPDGRTVDGTAWSESGEVVNGTIRRRGAMVHSLAAPARWTSNWSLFDAVQRLPAGAGPLHFDLLDELDLLKPAHHLNARPQAEASLGGCAARLRGFEQVGSGILPHTWWLDEQGRVLFALSGERGFLWDPEAGLGEDRR
jgi:hypothetical protein